LLAGEGQTGDGEDRRGGQNLDCVSHSGTSRLVIFYGSGRSARRARTSRNCA
jgi:hypothetical protein